MSKTIEQLPKKLLNSGFIIISTGHNHQLFHLSITLMLYFDISAVHADVVSPNGHWKALKGRVMMKQQFNTVVLLFLPAADLVEFL